MKLPRICFGYVPKLAFMCTKEKGNVHYIPTARHAAKKVVSGIFAVLGTAAFSCSILAASMCQTFFPCIGLLILGILLFIIAYCQYGRAWTRIEIPKLRYRKHNVSSITEREYLSLLWKWRFLSPGVYCHQVNRNIYICEGTKDNLKKILEKRSAKKNGTILIQELDLDAIRHDQLAAETQYQEVFQLPKSMLEDVTSFLRTSYSEEKSFLLHGQIALQGLRLKKCCIRIFPDCDRVKLMSALLCSQYIQKHILKLSKQQ